MPEVAGMGTLFGDLISAGDRQMRKALYTWCLDPAALATTSTTAEPGGLQLTVVCVASHPTPLASYLNECINCLSQAVVALLMWVQMLQATIVSSPMATFPL